MDNSQWVDELDADVLPNEEECQVADYKNTLLNQGEVIRHVGDICLCLFGSKQFHIRKTLVEWNRMLAEIGLLPGHYSVRWRFESVRNWMISKRENDAIHG